MEVAVLPRAAASLQAQHSRGASVSKWLLRNEFFGKVKIEVGNQHGPDNYKKMQLHQLKPFLSPV
jgi:hypothetical protein